VDYDERNVFQKDIKSAHLHFLVKKSGKDKKFYLKNFLRDVMIKL